MANPSNTPAKLSSGGTLRFYNLLGFSKLYNFILWFITMGYLLGFTLARLEYLSFNGRFCNASSNGVTGAAPGECYYYLQNPFRTGIMLHLFTILPAAFLVVFQFTPAVRHAAILFHRINSYLIITLSLISSAGVLIIAKHAFGGDMATRTWSGALVTSTTIAYVMAYINIKLLQIDQHRAWMMRAWAYFSTIITIRLIMFISANIISTMNGWYVTRPCAQIGSIFGPHHTVAVYPECQAYFNGTNPQQVAIVVASMSNGNPISIAATLGVSFGSAGWLAFWIHAVLVEVYLRLTPIESERLRQVSYERQLARRSKRPGYAGLVAERLGDSKPFVPDGNTHHMGHEVVAMDSLP